MWSPERLDALPADARFQEMDHMSYVLLCLSLTMVSVYSTNRQTQRD